MAKPDHHGRAGGGGFVAPFQRLTCFDDGECLGSIHPKRFQHLGRQDFADTAFQRQAAIGGTAIGRGARTLGPKVQQASRLIAHLGEQKAAPIANLGIVHAELVAVIFERQRLRQIIR